MALCYKDITFCKSDCVISKCFRHFSNEVAKEAEDFGLPVALADFSERCPSYQNGERNG